MMKLAIIKRIVTIVCWNIFAFNRMLWNVLLYWREMEFFLYYFLNYILILYCQRCDQYRWGITLLRKSLNHYVNVKQYNKIWRFEQLQSWSPTLCYRLGIVYSQWHFVAFWCILPFLHDLTLINLNSRKQSFDFSLMQLF